MLAQGILQSVVIVQQRRSAEELQRPQTGMAQQMDQGQVAKTQTDFRDNDADLRQRCEREDGFDVGLYAPDQIGQPGFVPQPQPGLSMYEK